MKRAMLVVGCLVLIAMVAPSFADTVWHFGKQPPPGVDGLYPVPGAPTNSYTVTEDAIPVTAWGFDNPSNDPHDVVFKVEGPDEHGLGLVGTNDNELTLASDNTPANYNFIDIANIVAAGYTNGMIRVQSVTNGEAYDVWGSNVFGVSNIGVAADSVLSDIQVDNTFVPISAADWAKWDFLTLTVHPSGSHPGSTLADNILLDDISATAPVPEPGTMGLLLMGLPALGLLRRKYAK